MNSGRGSENVDCYCRIQGLFIFRIVKLRWGESSTNLQREHGFFTVTTLVKVLWKQTQSGGHLDYMDEPPLWTNGVDEG